MTFKVPVHWESSDDWKHGVCNSCMHNSHESVQMVRQVLKIGNPDDDRQVEVWACPSCGYCRKL